MNRIALRLRAILSPGSSRGSVLLLVIIISLVVTIIASVGSQLVLTAYKDAKHQQYFAAEADSIARAGMVDAIAWFRRQATQPVASGYPPTRFPWVDGAFNPLYNTDPTLCDTIDQSIGIVKEYKLSDNGPLWARYEVKRQTDTAISPVDQYAVHDITGERLFAGEHNGQGYVWSIVSSGYIFRKKDASVKYDHAPNEIVGRSRVSTEIRKISLQLPAECAVLVSNSGTSGTRKVQVLKNGRVAGGDHYGVGYFTGYSPPYTVNNSTVTGKPTNFTTLAFNPTISYVLGVSTADIKIMADYMVKTVDDLPLALPDMALIYIEGNATFDSAKPLRSSGILVVNGNLTVSANSNALYSGLIYVTGTATIEDPCLISGCVIAYGGLTLSRASSADVAEIDYDATILDMVRQQVCRYREIKSAYRIFTGISDF